MIAKGSSSVSFYCLYSFLAYENGKYFEMSSFPELKGERLVSKKTADLRFLKYPFHFINNGYDQNVLYVNIQVLYVV